MIITAKPRISFLWIVLATLPWVAVIFKEKVMGIAFTFSMRKFVENPAALSFLLTLPWYISWVVPPVVNFIADRIWTRFGRRKPFIITSWVGTILSIGFMPLAPDFGWLLTAYIIFCVFNDLGSPVESLKMEIVPPAQRATSAAVLSWISQVAVLLFWVVAIGRFDEVTTMFGFTVSGEQGMYWAVSIGMVIMLLFVMLGIKETNPHSALLGERFSLRSVFGGLFSPHLWPVYILAFSVAILGTGLGAFNLLLITEQWGYTKQDQGTNIAIGGIINLFLIPLLGLLANKVGRAPVYVGLVIAGIVVNLAMYLYYTLVLYDARPTLVEMVVFGEMLSVIGILTGMALTPLVYDFIPRNELGTYAAGSGLVTKATNILTASLMGLFVWAWATMFLGPPGEMVRVTLRNPATAAQIQSVLNNARWADPATGLPLAQPSLTARPWYATGAALDHGRCFEIRLRNDNSRSLREQRDRLEAEQSKHKARKAYAINRLRAMTGRVPPPATRPADAEPVDQANVKAYADRLIQQAAAAVKTRMEAVGRTDKVARLVAEAEAEATAEGILAAGISQLEAILEQRAAAFRDQVQAVLSQQLLRDGEQILAAGVDRAIIASFPLSARPDAGSVERTRDRVRNAEASVIDLRVTPDGQRWALAVSALCPPDRTDAAAERLRQILQAQATKSLQKSMQWPPPPPRIDPAEAFHLDVRIIEDPLDRYPSPITRVVYAIMGLFYDQPTPQRRVNALGRAVRRPGVFDHTGASEIADEPNAVRLVAIGRAGAEVGAAQVSQAVLSRLGELLPAAQVAPAAALYAQAVPAAREQRMTIAKTVVAAAFAKQQYDYLAGYIAVFVLQLIGLGITFFFLYLVRIGRVRRRGAEEAEAVQ